jgi:hypothetical protein
MAAHKHAWETHHEVWIDPNIEVPAGELGAEHDKPYRVLFCAAADCPEQKRIEELDDAEAQALGIRLGKVVLDTLTLSQTNEGA